MRLTLHGLSPTFVGRFQLFYSPAVMDEWLDVSLVPRMRELHGLSDDEIAEFLTSLLPNANCFSPIGELSHELTRDITDTKFLALAHASRAEYLVTNDRRHLLPLQKLM